MPKESHANKVATVFNSAELAIKPLVSVLMLAYNHEDYIAQAIEGVVSQQCDFEFELIIGEDASKDKTKDIVLNYQKRFPKTIKVVCSLVNVGMQKNSQRLLEYARGEYLAYCEGDDYWCYDKKLLEQVSLISADKSIGLVHSDWVKSSKNNNVWTVNWKKTVHRRVARKYLEGNLFPYFFFPKILRTCTLMVRKEVAIAAERTFLRGRQYKFGDTIYNAYGASRYKVAYLPRVTAVYRLSQNSALRSGVRARIAFLKSIIDFDDVARLYFKRQDYPKSYRLEALIGLVFFSMAKKDIATFFWALKDLYNNYNFNTFFKAVLESIACRIPCFIKSSQ